jgi:hypothetical protein
VLEDFTVETFAPRVGETFRVDTGSATVEMCLTEVTESEGAGPSGRTPFSLVFLDAGGEVLPQHIYPFEHDELGSFEIFIVPIGQDPDGVRYEAVFT